MTYRWGLHVRGVLISFFFTKTRAIVAPVKAAGKRSPLAAPTAGRVNPATLHRLGCSGCPLNAEPDVHTPRMEPTIGNGPVYFMAEAPGGDEDTRSGRPLTGPSGKLLRECLPSGVERHCSYDNVCNCRPPKNRTPVWAEMECCRPRREKWIEQVKPKLIVGLGAVPLQWALGTTDLQGMRGRFFAIKVGSHECHFMPTYHPSFILRTAYDKRKPLNSRMGHCFRMDIKRAFDALPLLEPMHIDTEAEIKSGVQCFDGSKAEDYGRLCALLDNARASPVKSVDIETRGLRPFSNKAAIISAAISFGSTNFSFGIAHPNIRFSGKELTHLLHALQALLRDHTLKIAHNSPFELEWFIWKYGKEVVNPGAWECTQMQAHFIDERRGKRGSDDDHRAPYQSLDFLCRQHFGIRYKSLFKLNKKDMAQSPLGEVLLYNGIDTKYTLKLWHQQNKLLKHHNLYDAYLDSLPRQPTVALIQTLGVPVDQPIVKVAQAKLGREIKGIEAEIGSLDVVQQFATDRKGFNPLSGPDAITIFKEYLGNKGIKNSVDKGVLEQIDHPLAKLIVRLRNRTKMKSTYVDGLELGKGDLIYPDGKLHTNFNTTFTETGRLSSDAANMQNFPKRNDAWVRKAIVAPEGYLMVAVDYGQLEACTGAMCSKDEYLVNALWNDYDIHAEWARKIAERMPHLVGGIHNISVKEVMGKFRSLVKNKMVFPAFFGATNESVREYLASGTGCEVDQKIVDDIMDQFWSTFAGMDNWQTATMKRYYDIGFVETLCGRRHHYPLTKNQAVNMPIQGTAAELVCDAMCRLSDMALQTGNWDIHPVLNIHDDLSFFIPDKDPHFSDCLSIISKEMLTFDYPWINVPMSIEISVGKNWAELKKFDKLWSHKDI